MAKHDLKCWPEFYAPLKSGLKNFDLRVNDRRYAVGDTVVFHEYDDRKGAYTGEKMPPKKITYVLQGVGVGGITPIKGLSRDYCILALVDAP